MVIAGHAAGKLLCEALGLDPRRVQGLRVEFNVKEPVRVFVRGMASISDVDHLCSVLGQIDRKELHILEEGSMNEVDRYWNQIPVHVRDAIVKQIVTDWISQTSAKPAAAPAAESASVPVPPSAIAGHDEDDAA